MITIEQAQQIIAELRENNAKGFSSHDFIFCYIREFSKQYAAEVQEVNTKLDGDPFQSYHSQIGRFLINNANALGIAKVSNENSMNVKGYESPVATWRFIN